jgi:hypothetical protein
VRALQIVLLVLALCGIAAGNVSAATRATIGTNALVMPKGVSTYRISLGGTAARVSTIAPPTSVASPTGRFAVEVGDSGTVLIDGQRMTRRILSEPEYTRVAYWSSRGLLAFTTRRSDVELLVVLDPVRNVRRVVASGVCDASSDPWSPDGTTLAVSVSMPHRGCDGSRQTVVGVSKAMGGAMRRIAKPPTVPIAWTRDSRRLLVEARRPSGASVVRLVDPRTGTGPRVLSSYSTLGRGGIWSNGHRFFALAAINNRQHGELLLIDGSLRRRVALFTYPRQFSWSQTGQLLAIATDTSIKVFDAAVRRTIATIPIHAPYGIGVESITWARDGQTVDIVAAPSLDHD